MASKKEKLKALKITLIVLIAAPSIIVGGILLMMSIVKIFKIYPEVIVGGIAIGAIVFLYRIILEEVSNEAIEVNRDVLSDKEIASLNTNALKNYKALGENPKPLTIGYEILNNNQQEYQVYRGTPEVLFRGTKDECKAYVRDNEYDKGYS